MPGKPGPQKGVRRTQGIAAELRSLIHTGEWPPGHIVPSQHELARQHGVAASTAWQAVTIVENEGLVEGVRGGRFVVTDRKPIHGLVLNPRLIYDNQWKAVPAARPPRFIQREGTGEPERGWTIDIVTVPDSIAIPLGFEPEADAHTRAMLLAAGGMPILTSVSYLPTELADGEGWREVGVAELALTGHEVTEGAPRAPSRIPTPLEQQILKMNRGVPVYVLCQPYRVMIAGREVPAGVVVTARGDRVYLQ